MSTFYLGTRTRLLALIANRRGRCWQTEAGPLAKFPFALAQSLLASFSNFSFILERMWLLRSASKRCNSNEVKDAEKNLPLVRLQPLATRGSPPLNNSLSYSTSA